MLKEIKKIEGMKPLEIKEEQKIPKPIPEKNSLEDIEKMKEYLSDEGCKEFRENLELTKFINSGSEGIFYEGKIKKMVNKKVGIKFIIKKKNDLKNLNEIRIHNSLKNKNVINLYGYFTLKEASSCIIMEYSKYGDLRNFQKNLLKKKYLPETFLCYITKQILDGLESCHRMKIVHMDIKPQNVLVDYSLNVKLTDFSVSINYSPLKKGDEIKLPFFGTTLYMAPEILKGIKIKVENFNKIDMYSLGVLIYTLAFNKYPYNITHDDSTNSKTIYEKIKSEPLVIPTDTENIFSKYFNDFLKKLLSDDIKKRMSLYQALEHPWIKGAQILFDEKEKLCNMEKFLIYLISDNFMEFNNYINRT